MILKYFIDANSATGYVCLQKENFAKIAKIYYLKTPDDKLVHNLLEQVALVLAPRRLALEYIYSTFNPNYLTGLVIKELDVAFTSGKFAPDECEVVDLMSVYDALKIKENLIKIERISTNMNQFYKKMYMHFNVALHIYDEWGKIYSDRMDVEKADIFKVNFLFRLFDSKIPTSKLESQLVHRFFGTSTPDGLRDFLPELTIGLKRYLIKGPPGTGKSTLLKAVVKKAVELGYDADIYYCLLNPKSLDMVVIPELNFCLFDATAPHEYAPVFINDEVIDTYALFIKEDTDKRCSSILEDIKSRYDHQIKLALVAMKDGHAAKKQLSVIYNEALVIKEFDVLLEQLIRKL